jgi:hypothetical protein
VLVKDGYAASFKVNAQRKQVGQQQLKLPSRLAASSPTEEDD